jgi:hypothetical protein
MSKASSMEAASQIAAIFSHTIYVGPQPTLYYLRKADNGRGAHAKLVDPDALEL